MPPSDAWLSRKARCDFPAWTIVPFWSSAGEDEPRSRSAMLSANQLLGANSCSSPSWGESSMVESLPS